VTCCIRRAYRSASARQDTPQGAIRLKEKVKNAWIDRELMRDFEAEGTDAYRLCTIAGGWVERFGPDILISFKDQAGREQLTTQFVLWAEAMRFNTRRIFERFLPKRNEERKAPKVILGDSNLSPRTIVMERGLRYAVDFRGGYSVGLFLDQRENRSFLRKASPARLLNCFAYTCSFSVAAAIAGARTVNVDLSQKSLERGRQNFSLNNLPVTGDQFIADDVFEVLPRLARKGERYDSIVLDPPTFSRSHRGKMFKVQSNFEALLLKALEVAERDARILLSTNCATMNERALEVMARFCLKASRRAGTLHSESRPRDFPPASGAASVWLTLR
jgi:23S rRNA (cytosine1962-C5)-methyltransferase